MSFLQESAWGRGGVGKGLGVRCSSTGEAASMYHDAASASFENINGGRPITAVMSGGAGLRGTIVPRATAFGGSRGIDPHKPRLVNIDPDIRGRSCVVDMSAITKEKMDAAYAAAAQNPDTADDIRLHAAQTFHNLAVSYEPVEGGSGRALNRQSRSNPLGGLGYVVPKASRGGGQEADEQPKSGPLRPAGEYLLSPSVSPRTKLAASASVTVQPQVVTHPTADTSTPAERQQAYPSMERLAPVAAYPVPAQPIAKLLNVKFTMDGWGDIDAYYHDVIRENDVLVLVIDKRSGGVKFFPPAADKGMLCSVEGSKYKVRSYGMKFSHENYEYCVLLIEEPGS